MAQIVGNKKICSKRIKGSTGNKWNGKKRQEKTTGFDGQREDISIKTYNRFVTHILRKSPVCI